jgi:Tfp pilus assembly PilM family ATPase
VREHLDVLLACDLEPVAIEVAPSALARCASALRGATGGLSASAPDAHRGTGRQAASGTPDDGESEAAMVVDIGYAATKVLIARHGRVMFFKLIDIGGRHFDDVVAKALGVSPQRASELRRRVLRDAECADESEATAAAVRAAVSEPVQQLAREIALCQRYYSVTFRGARPQRALVVGGESRYTWLTDALGEGMGAKLRRHDPFAGVDLSSVRGQLGAGEAGAVWACAAGLAWREQGWITRGAP